MKLDGSHTLIIARRLAPPSEGPTRIDANSVLQSALVVAIIAISGKFNDFPRRRGVPLPAFVTALFMGIVLSNAVPPRAPRLPRPAGTPSLALMAETG